MEQYLQALSSPSDKVCFDQDAVNYFMKGLTNA